MGVACQFGSGFSPLSDLAIPFQPPISRPKRSCAWVCFLHADRAIEGYAVAGISTLISQRAPNDSARKALPWHSDSGFLALSE